MGSRCDYLMYFPSVPISSLSDPLEYISLPRRKHVYLGETVQFLFVLRSRNAAQRDGRAGCPDLSGPLCAQASVGVAESQQHRPEEFEGGGEEEPREGSTEPTDSCGTGHVFRDCSPLLSHSSGGGRPPAGEPVRSALMLDGQVVFCLTVSLDKLPVNTLKAKIMVTVWRQEEEKVELREYGYLTLLQLRGPTHTFRQDRSPFKAQVSTILNVLPPPSVQCRQMTVCGKHLTVLKVLNHSSQEEVCIRDMKVIPNYNSSYLPMMPDGSVLIVDNVCHQSAEVTVASFYRIDSQSSHLPSILSSLEEQNFMFQLQLQDKAEDDSSEGLEVPLVAVIEWDTPALPFTRCILSFYSLPSIRVTRPQLVMTASCASPVRPLERFWVTYTLRNSLQDFLAIRLIWNAEGRGGEQDPLLGAVVCQSPSSHLGQCRRGSTLCFAVAFQVLRTGLFELGQHMKLILQFRAPVSSPAMVSRMNPSSLSPSVPSSTELQEGCSLGRFQSFSHQTPSTSHHIRSGSMMEHQSAAPPVGCPLHRELHPPTDATVSLDKIAKRECKVLVLESTPEAQGRSPLPERSRLFLWRR